MSVQSFLHHEVKNNGCPLAMRWNESMSFATKWMQWTMIMLGEWIYPKKDKVVFHFQCLEKEILMILDH